MTHFQKSLVIDADAAGIYAALTTPQGLAAWWTEDCDVPAPAQAGDVIRFRFSCNDVDMRVEGLTPGREVRWRCVREGRGQAQGEWEGTSVVFRLTPQGPGRTRVDFEHVGLVPALECYERCREGWTHFLDSLRLLAETGQGTPHRKTEAGVH